MARPQVVSSTTVDVDPLESRIPAVAFQNLVGASEALRSAIALGCKVASHGTTVLLHGETGTGKELFARGIHYSGDAANEPFVAINCAAIPESLLESELFGHERGAFSGAISTKPGLFEFAARGTVFLDEIGDMPVALQAKLLRALEVKQVRRLGSLKERPITCRIIAATNCDLEQAVATGAFREDLYYRLSVVSIDLPPLRARGCDIPLLANVFLHDVCRQYGIRVKQLGPDAVDVLQKYNWPGNVRELKNTIERAVVLADGDTIRAEHIVVNRRRVGAHQESSAGETRNPAIEVPPGGLTIDDAEKRLISLTLAMSHNNQSMAARMLGISRSTLLRKLRHYQISA